MGDRVDSTRTGEALRALYRTGFFRDVRIEREGFRLYVPITTCIVISLVLSGVAWVFGRLR